MRRTSWLLVARAWVPAKGTADTVAFPAPAASALDAIHGGIDAGQGKYPPAESGALGIGPLEAATLNPKLCLLGRRTKYALPTSPRSFIQFFATPENRCLFRMASPLDGVKVHRSSVVKLHFVCVVAHDLRVLRWATAVNVKLILPPLQSRGLPVTLAGV